MAIVEVTDVHKTFEIPGEDIKVLKGISLSVAKGEFVAIMGASGSGKSTLLNILSSIEEVTSGNVLIDGEISTKENLVEIRRHKTSIIYQDFNNLAYLSAIENVMFPMMLAGKELEAARSTAQKLLEKVHLAHRADHIPDDLSGGEQQRVSIARALANNPQLILADEPTGNLDTKTGDSSQKRLIEYLFSEMENYIEKRMSWRTFNHDSKRREKQRESTEIRSFPPP
ncbi:MAG: ABC transporter ATP-binding protein [Candidatus Hodarchaeales archaeon]